MEGLSQMVGYLRSGLMLTLFFCVPSGLSCAQDWSELPQWSTRPTILGYETTVLLKPKFKISPVENSLQKLEIDLNADISDALAKAPVMLQDAAKKRSDKCGTRWNFPDLAPLTVESGSIRVAGTIRAEQYACAFGAKAKLAQVTGDFVVMLSPTWAPEKVGLKAELKQFDFGNDAASDLGLEDELRQGLQYLLDRIVEGASVEIPPDIQALRPVIDEATFVKGERTYLAAKAHISLTSAQFQKLLTAFIAISSKS